MLQPTNQINEQPVEMTANQLKVVNIPRVNLGQWESWNSNLWDQSPTTQGTNWRKWRTGSLQLCEASIAWVSEPVGDYLEMVT